MRVVISAIVTLATLISAADSASADPQTRTPWYRGKHGNNRIINLVSTGAFTAAYLITSTFKPKFETENCRWCNPPGFDRATRNALVWKNTTRADTLSTVDAYIIAPIVGVSLLVASDHDASATRLIDDVLPVIETVAIGQFVTQAIKFSVARQRPFVHFGDPNRPYQSDDNTSFSSGHSSLGFSITAASGLICHWRHYWTEPYVWGTGIALSLSTEYLRMGADKHYLTDVLAGGAVGIAAGLLVPRFMRRDIVAMPTSNGIALAGAF